MVARQLDLTSLISPLGNLREASFPSTETNLTPEPAVLAILAAVAIPVLRHRIAPNFGAMAEGINSVKIIEHLLETIPQNG